jgi:hypothetical protein
VVLQPTVLTFPYQLTAIGSQAFTYYPVGIEIIANIETSVKVCGFQTSSHRACRASVAECADERKNAASGGGEEWDAYK